MYISISMHRVAVVIREREREKKMETKNVGSSVNNGSRRSYSPLDGGLNGGRSFKGTEYERKR